jgi:hypothetical protein
MNSKIQERLDALKDLLWEQAEKTIKEAQETDFEEYVEREYDHLREEAAQTIGGISSPKKPPDDEINEGE